MNSFPVIMDAIQRLADVSAHMQNLIEDLGELRKRVAQAERRSFRSRRRRSTKSGVSRRVPGR
ncbi:hypothetical protein D4Q52_00730 [Rhodopseudomonas palustris]|uniref:Uncharacterized protein n=1 Tax=Rhodopseudomonas palustris TaxID=1076 RepID=A0A418VQT7_RHOPL|nr:hypothetical protein D4Q52_00730 [Rhodopseudomonas palustris]